ncbi:MAG: DEAD/DEAH box helicase [Candidatus Sungbacteria bacterium]|uniref:DEAD/DEAH box helicase n=1 Tax=Candidatus Sungiibacteriota bacterium TaxID=2750080 RepID=A0A9D6DP38_9BACT|nr:DEAD/DEAH box helicase [Candidatus Sungbacteria bacterium]
MTETEESILIAANIPEFINQGVLWFQENQNKIRILCVKNLWWRNHIRLLEKDLKINPLSLIRELTDFGYVKTSRVLNPGEISFMGSVLTVWPINLDSPAALDFNGNLIESLTTLGKPPRSDLGTKSDLEKLEAIYTRFKPGDYVVHVDHGIGKLKGVTPDLENYFEIEYALGDKLFLPFEQTKKISLYVGFTRPKIHRLGGSLWSKVKTKAKEDVVKLAKDLLQLYAHREVSRGFSFIKETDELKNLITDFEYPETPDQTQAWREISADMENEKPMDRVLAGDVGFGKTELAVRAAFKAALSGKQTALIAPTTILARQHFDVFQNRLEKYGVNTAMLSRLNPEPENKKLAQKIKSGLIDVTIGTHRLLSKDVEFKDLGLLIIDEEQRFGVLQKEKIKKLKTNIDVLMLSATPIPRTLYLAMSNLKPISKIQTAPLGREAVATRVEKFSWDLIKSAIEFELARNGQVFFLENRIHKIGRVIDNLKKIVPQSRLAALHGRLGEKQIIGAVESFKKGETNILVSTTIIENGIDLPNANTLIVSDATRLGLSQAHQLRGRVGRRDIKAAVYFLYNPKKLTAIAQSRLAALQEFSNLGDGFKIALRDLELRGAGNILGRSQSGRINQIGLNLYCEMLSQAVEKLKS